MFTLVIEKRRDVCIKKFASRHQEKYTDDFMTDEETHLHGLFNHSTTPDNLNRGPLTFGC
jgi:hypothetical protein